MAPPGLLEAFTRTRVRANLGRRGCRCREQRTSYRGGLSSGAALYLDAAWAGRETVNQQGPGSIPGHSDLTVLLRRSIDFGSH